MDGPHDAPRRQDCDPPSSPPHTPLRSPWRRNAPLWCRRRSIFINFDEKDGSGEAFDADVLPTGIRLPDGTFWEKVGPLATSSVPGNYSDSSHPGCVRRIAEDGTVFGEDPPGLLTPGSVCRCARDGVIRPLRAIFLGFPRAVMTAPPLLCVACSATFGCAWLTSRSGQYSQAWRQDDPMAAHGHFGGPRPARREL